jgi:hypothetical protein
VRGGQGADAVGVAGTRLTTDLEVERGEDSPRGRVDTKATRDFVGWLGFVAALCALISGPLSTDRRRG